MHWIHALPNPKDGTTVLRVLEQVPPVERLPTLALSPDMPPDLAQILQGVAIRRAWDEKDQKALKALGDPTRLRILRYLTAEPQTPVQLARRLRLRVPTVIHHLHTLRLAELVHLTLGKEDKRRYAARPEAVAASFATLKVFLERDETGTSGSAS